MSTKLFMDLNFDFYLCCFPLSRSMDFLFALLNCYCVVLQQDNLFYLSVNLISADSLEAFGPLLNFFRLKPCRHSICH